MSQMELKRSSREHTRSYKDLIKEEKMLNAELRRLGPGSMGKQSQPAHHASSDKNTLKKTNESSYREMTDLRDKLALHKLKKPSYESTEAQHSAKPHLHLRHQISGQNLSQQPASARLSQSALLCTSCQGSNIGKDSLSKSILLKKIQELENRSHGDTEIQRMPSQQLHEGYHQKILEYEVFTPPSTSAGFWNKELGANKEGLIDWIRQNIVGFNTSYVSPMQLELQTVYVDHTATNRPFRVVEIMVEYAKLFAANPHTEFSRFGKYSTEMMHYAHRSMLQSFNASPDEFVVLPTGSGSTGAIEKAVRVLKNLEEQEKWENPTIFLTPYEHHSNILPWVEFYENIQLLAHDDAGTLQFEEIAEQLRSCPNKNIIVTVSAASNVTSKLTDLFSLNEVIKVARQEGRKRIIFCTDCAAFCCHHDLNLQVYTEVDFAFLSPHKNLGGAESCGVLLARKSFMEQSKPTFPGGGTVRFVKGYKKEDVLYEVDVFSREIAGTPPFFGFYRSALSFELLKNAIGYDFIHEREKRNTELFFSMIDRANQQLREQNKPMVIRIYGERNLERRANVISFNYEYGRMKFIQHSFASLLFTDIFGIQVRSGCFCAGPYGIDLLKITQDIVDEIEEEVEAGIMINKPGYLRLDLTFYLEEYEIEYIAQAIILIARYWQNLEKLYTVCKDGEVILLPTIAKKHEPELYSLDKFVEAYDKIKSETVSNKDKLKNRRQTLERQLRVGEFIAQHPTEFVKRIKAGKPLAI